MIEKLILETYGINGIFILIALSMVSIGIMWSVWTKVNDVLRAAKTFSTLDLIMVGTVFFLAALGVVTRIVDYVKVLPQ